MCERVCLWLRLKEGSRDHERMEFALFEDLLFWILKVYQLFAITFFRWNYESKRNQIKLWVRKLQSRPTSSGHRSLGLSNLLIIKMYVVFIIRNLNRSVIYASFHMIWPQWRIIFVLGPSISSMFYEGSRA